MKLQGREGSQAKAVLEQVLWRLRQVVNLPVTLKIVCLASEGRNTGRTQCLDRV